MRRHLGIPRKRRRASLHVVWRRSCWIAIALSLAGPCGMKKSCFSASPLRDSFLVLEY